jgi:hypothetical protein
MTDATSKPPNVLELVAERFGVDAEIGSTHPSILDDPTRVGAALPQRDPGAAGQRLRAIAAIHALADWYVEHPDVPAPSSVTAYSYVRSVGDVAALAVQLGEHPYLDGEQFDVSVTPSGEDDCWAGVTIRCRRADRPL